MSGTNLSTSRTKPPARRATRDRRPRADDVRRDHHDGRERQGRAGEGARHYRVRRSTVLPDVPTIAEAGVPGYEATIWIGVMAPAGTPKEIVDKLNAEINQVIDRADVKEAWEKQGAAPHEDEPGRVRQVPAGRHREMGARGQGLGDADAVAVRPLPPSEYVRGLGDQPDSRTLARWRTPVRLLITGTRASGFRIGPDCVSRAPRRFVSSRIYRQSWSPPPHQRDANGRTRRLSYGPRGRLIV